ncbi:hypothetical protein EV360DRAFT_73082 [Lentinula raphanica]|nr:hypothetical protein EV360DRAFT_73082 [Lentinula raphanica]
MLLSLPNELLHAIIEYIAYNPKLPDSLSKSLFKRASFELLALSSTDWRLRQVCVPFLFANIKIRHIRDAQKLENYLPLFSELTKILVIGPVAAVSEAGNQIIVRNLPQFKQLFYVELRRCRERIVLLKTILAHPTVTSVLVDGLPHASMCNDDLSKVILDRATSVSAFSPTFEKYFNRGMRLACLELSQLGSLDKQFESKVLPGLNEIRMHMGIVPVSFSFLSIISSTHPALHELWLLDDRQHHFDYYTPPFISSFVRDCRKQDLNKYFVVKHVGIRRSTDQSSLGCTSLIEILIRIASSFPKLEVLTLNFDGHIARYHVNEFAMALGRFSSLRTLSLHGVFKLLNFKSNTSLPPVRRVNPKDAFDAALAHAETGILLFASRVAREVRSLETIYVKDKGYENPTYSIGKFWRLRKRAGPKKLPQLQQALLCAHLFQSRASPELIALSLANWQLRQVCMPLLFANIRVRLAKDVKRMMKCLSLFSKLIKILVIDYFSDSLEAGDHIISQNLAQFEQLFYVELGGCSRRTFLLRALLAHPTVTSILVGELPDKSMCNNDLSKVICNDQTAECAFSDFYQNYFNQGMRLHRLELLPLRTLDDLLRSKLFPGLREIRMVMGVKPFSSSLLSVVSAAHPTVNEFWLIDDRNLHFLQHTPPFISSFIEECQEQDLKRFFIIERVGLGKAIGQSPWQFVSLRTLFLYGVYKRLNFGSKKLVPPVRVRSMDTFDAMVARVETGTLCEWQSGDWWETPTSHVRGLNVSIVDAAYHFLVAHNPVLCYLLASGNRPEANKINTVLIAYDSKLRSDAQRLLDEEQLGQSD